MAENDTAPAPEIDVDSLSEAEFSDLKTKIRSETAVEAPPAAEQGEPAPAAQPNPDAPSDDDADDTELNADGTRKTVPHGQFHRERERRKAAEDERQKLAENYQKLLDRTTQLLQPPPQAEPEEPAIPSWAGPDPLAAGEWTQKELIALKTQLAEKSKQEQERANVSQVLNSVNAVLERDIQADPTVKDAHQALRKSYGEEYLAMGYTPQQALQAVNELERQHAIFMYQNNIPPGEYLKRLGAARGWVAKAPEPANDTNQQTEAERIAKQEQTRIASLSLGRTGGAVVNTGTITPEQLLDMSDEDFDAYKKKHGSVATAFRAAS
jgi:hypothetical protein